MAEFVKVTRDTVMIKCRIAGGVHANAMTASHARSEHRVGARPLLARDEGGGGTLEDPLLFTVPDKPCAPTCVRKVHRNTAKRSVIAHVKKYHIPWYHCSGEYT